MLQTVLPTPKKGIEEQVWVSFPARIRWDADFEAQAGVFRSSAERLLGLSPIPGEGGVVLTSDPTLEGESYRVEASESGLVISAGCRQGICYGMATALLCLQAKNDGFSVRKLTVEDRPDKDYRGLMVDLANFWHPLPTLFKYVDVCFLLKVKYLHLHFIDRARYTLPSRAFPQIGGGKEQYTEAEIAALNEYALDRGIVIIPELEAPGHATSMTRTYPEVFANRIPDGVDGRVETDVGVLSAETVVCPGRQECMDGICTLLDEICALFPHSPYIHIGGDEAAYPAWDHCPDCRAYMQAHGIADSHELYSEFVGRVARAVLDRGRTPIVWEGFPEKGVCHIPKETVVIAWESLYLLAPDLLRHGFKIINGSWKPLYIVDNPALRWGPKEIMDWDVYQLQNWWEKSAAYRNPVRVEPSEEVLGAQVSSWGCTYEQEISRVVEYLCALTERTWNIPRLHDETAFNARLRATARKVFLLIAER